MNTPSWSTHKCQHLTSCISLRRNLISPLTPCSTAACTSLSNSQQCPLRCSFSLGKRNHKVSYQGCTTGAAKCHQTCDVPIQPLPVDRCVSEHCHVDELHVCPDKHAAILCWVSEKLSLSDDWSWQHCWYLKKNYVWTTSSKSQNMVTIIFPNQGYSFHFLGVGEILYLHTAGWHMFSGS